MIAIVFEGIPGSGKTTLARWLSDHLGLPLYCEDALAPEVFVLWRTWRDDDSELFLLHWEIKHRIAKLVGIEGVWDRNHMSALAYNYAKARLKRDPELLSAALGWYRTAIGQGLLSEPSYYIVLDVPPDVALQRKTQPPGLNCVWASPAGLAGSREFYRHLEHFIEPHPPDAPPPRVIRLHSGGRLPDIKRAILRAL